MIVRAMRRTIHVCIVLLIAVVGCKSSNPAGRPPNIIHIVTDDMAWDDIGCFGATDVSTPNIDALCATGMKLTSYYSPASVCTPSRAAMLTGRYSNRVDGCHSVLFPNSRTGIERSEITIAELLKQRGYRTAIVGKWHLGHQPQYLPLQHGFDHYFGIPYPNDFGPERLGGTGSRGYPPIPLWRDDKIIEQPVDLKPLPDRFTADAIAFIRSNRDRPFYLHYANIETHTPWFVPDRFNSGKPNRRYLDAIECLDWSVGEIVRAVKELGIEKDTLLVFSSDNGPLVERYDELEKCYGEYAQVDTSRKHKLRGGKYQARFEGGTRVCAFAVWNDRIAPGTSSDAMVAGFDWFNTFAEVAGAPIPTDRTIDGRSLVPLLTGSAQTPRQVFFGIFKAQVQSVRQAKWKLACPAKPGEPAQLFDLSNDLSETTDLSGRHPQLVEQLEQLRKLAESAFADGKPVPQ